MFKRSVFVRGVLMRKYVLLKYIFVIQSFQKVHCPSSLFSSFQYRWHKLYLQKVFWNHFRTKRSKKEMSLLGGSPSLVVMGGDSCTKGREFESWHRKLDGHFFTFICVFMVNCTLISCWRQTKRRCWLKC